MMQAIFSAPRLLALSVCLALPALPSIAFGQPYAPQYQQPGSDEDDQSPQQLPYAPQHFQQSPYAQPQDRQSPEQYGDTPDAEDGQANPPPPPPPPYATSPYAQSPYAQSPYAQSPNVQSPNVQSPNAPPYGQPQDGQPVAYGSSCDTGPRTSCGLVRQAPVGARCTCPGYNSPTYGSVR